MTPRFGPGPLAVLGITGTAERVYRFVLRNSGCDVHQICDGTGARIEEVRADLASLADRLLVRLADGVVTPDDPELALGRLMQMQSRQLGETEQALAVLEGEVQSYVAEHVAGGRPGRHPVAVDVVAPGDFAALITTMVPQSTGELLFLRPDQWNLPTGARMDVAVAAAIRGGRASRSIYPAAIIENSPALVRDRVRAGELVKVVPHVPTRMAIFGSEGAILPYRWGEHSGVRLLIREPGIIALCVAYFDQLWGRAVTVSALRADSNREPRQALLELLASGAKDEQIARLLDMSLRTVRRRVAALMADLGVDSRFQAGMEAVRRNWL